MNVLSFPSGRHCGFQLYYVIHFFSPLETKKPAFYSKVCSAKKMLVKYESENENQNVISLESIIVQAN